MTWSIRSWDKLCIKLRLLLTDPQGASTDWQIAKRYTWVYILTNFMAYETRKFYAAFTWALQ